MFDVDTVIEQKVANGNAFLCVDHRAVGAQFNVGQDD
jgi:hypothetical protein